MSASTITAISFIVACILSTWPGNKLVKFVYSMILSRAPSPTPNMMMNVWLDGQNPDRVLADFRGKTAWIIGTLERILFIYALQFSQQSLITGVLILKAFFAWTDRTPGVPPSAGEPNDTTEMKFIILETKARYHTYIIGNFLSLTMAILLYEGAVYVFPIMITKLIP